MHERDSESPKAASEGRLHCSEGTVSSEGDSGSAADMYLWEEGCSRGCSPQVRSTPTPMSLKQGLTETVSVYWLLPRSGFRTPVTGEPGWGEGP